MSDEQKALFEELAGSFDIFVDSLYRGAIRKWNPGISDSDLEARVAEAMKEVKRN